MTLQRCVAAALLLAVGACTTQPKRAAVPTPPPPASAAAPAPPPKPAVAPVPPKPAKPVAKPTAPTEVKVLAPATYEQDKARIKLALAKTNAPDTLPPGDVGYTLDVLQGRLRQVVGKSAGITRQADRIVIDLSGKLGYAPGTDQVDEAGQQTLASLAKVLVEYRTTFVSVLVRTGGETNGQSDLRALSLVRFLTQAGVSPKRIVVVGQGVANGDAPGDVVARVEVLIEPIVREVEVRS